MLKLFKYLKKSAVVILAIIILLVGQAFLDLELPNYISEIVNVGIQTSGIENSVPKIVSKENMEDILFLSDNDEKILENYELVEKNYLSDEEEEVLDDLFIEEPQKVLESDSVYLLKDISDEKINELEEIMIDGILLYSVFTNEQTSVEFKNQLLSQMQEEQKILMQELSVIEILEMMPKEVQTEVITAAKTEFEKMDDMFVEQAGVMGVTEIYNSMGVDIDKIQNDYIIRAGLQMLGIALASTVTAISVLFLSSRIAAQLGKILRDKVFKKVLSFSNKELREFSTASLITRSTNDISQIQQLMTMLFRVVIYAPILGLGGFVKVLIETDISMAWIIGVAILAVIVVIGILFIFLMPSFKKLQGLIDKLNLVSREILTGLPVIRAFNKEKNEEKRFNVASMDLKKVNSIVNTGMGLMMPLITFIMNVIMVLIVWVGAENVEAGTIQVGDILAFMQYAMQIIMSFLMISIVSIMLPRATVSAKRINEILDTDESIKDKKDAKSVSGNVKGLVEFKNVCFKYPDADTEVLTDISFSANPGETTAIIGSTGSGKSTIINLIPRFYDITEGNLLIDGIDIREYTQKSLRDIIGYVPQKGMLFSGTIESNIKFSDSNMNDEKMQQAAKIAQAEDFINNKENKYNDEIAQGGTNVSGGQKQRLSIARAIAKEPKIYIFDDSFSALDFKTDKVLREALADVTKDKTVIIVAQRINTIMGAEKIIVLEEGQIVGMGTHDELLATNETYKEIALSQLSEEELSGKGGM